MILRFLLDRIKVLFDYDADRDFYAKVFPGSVDRSSFIRMRDMRLTDLPDVLAIEQKVYNYPWSEGIFKDCLSVGYYCYVCENLDGVIGYAILSVQIEEAHIMNLCVDPAVQGRGYGRKMLEKLILVSRDKFADNLFLEVRPSNKVAIALYKKMGFNEIGVRKGYYPAKDGREDALMLALML